MIISCVVLGDMEHNAIIPGDIYCRRTATDVDVSMLLLLLSVSL